MSDMSEIYSFLYAFWDCSGFDGELKLPDTLESIGPSAFGGCSGFDGELKLPDNLKGLENNAFVNCRGFSGLKLPDGLKSIESAVFFNCSGLSGELKLPSSLTSIGINAFYHCTSLSGELVIPASVTIIDSGAFEGDSGIHTIRFEGGKPEFYLGAFDGITANAYYPAGDLTWENIESEGIVLGDITWISYEKEQQGTVSGQCGDNLTWTLENGTLTISGTGDMWDYTYTSDGQTEAPWGIYEQQLTQLILDDGITYIGDNNGF